MLFKEQEAGYLAGYLAGLEAKRENASTIGSVGGFKEPPVDRFIAGYQAGAKEAMPGIETLNGYSSDWDDQAKCKELALNQIARGAQIVFQVAGGCGLGALDAAREKNVWGIGVDADQSFLGPHVLTSAQKRVDEGVFRTIESVVDGSWQGGRNLTFGLAEDGVGLGKISTKVPQEDLDALDDVKQRLRDGEITDPDERLAAGDSGDHAHFARRCERRFEPLGSPRVLAVDVHVDEPAQVAALVEEEVGDRKCAECVADGCPVDLELALPARLLSEEPGQLDYDHSPISTERIGGSWRAISCQSSPSEAETKTEPLWVPK